MTEIANTPELRFPNYENSWFSYKLNDISERVTRKNKNLESQRPLTISGQLGLIDQIEYFNKSVSSKNLTGYTLIKKGEFAYNKSYSNGYPLGAIKKLERYDLGILSSLYICFSFDENIDKSFMKNYFESTKWYREVANIAVEGARNHGLLNIPVNDFFNININLPIQYEQEKIGEFFSKLDQQIELEEQKLAKLEEQKKGYMQKIFSKELRFKDENGNNYPEWEEKKLKELIDVRDGTHESPKPSKEGYLLVTSKNLKNSKLDLSDSYFISKEDYESINQRSKVEIGDILFGMIGTIGNPILLEECGFAIKNVALLKTNDLLEKYYILNFLKSSNISKQFYRMNAGGTQKFIALSTIRDLNIDMPSSEEAIKIGNFFNKVDNLIENQLNKVELLKQRKQSFLQKMFV